MGGPVFWGGETPLLRPPVVLRNDTTFQFLNRDRTKRTVCAALNRHIQCTTLGTLNVVLCIVNLQAFCLTEYLWFVVRLLCWRRAVTMLPGYVVVNSRLIIMLDRTPVATLLFVDALPQNHHIRGTDHHYDIYNEYT